MEQKFYTALIAGIISLIIAFVSYFANKRSIESKSKDLEKQHKHNFKDKLNDLRLQHYAKAFRITEKIYYVKAPHYITNPDDIIAIHNELVDWKSGEASLIMSQQTIESFRKLRETLCKRPGHGDKYSKDQAEKILKLKSRFRGTMRGDIGFLDDLDDNLK